MTHWILRAYRMGSEREFKARMESGQFPNLKELQEEKLLEIFCGGKDETDGYYTYNAQKLDSFVSKRSIQPHELGEKELNPLKNHADTLAMLLGEQQPGGVLVLEVDYPNTTPLSVKQRYQRYKVYVLDDKLREKYKKIMT